MKSKFLDKPLICLVLIAALGIVVYSNTFRSPFTFDDVNFVYSQLIKDISNIPSIFMGHKGPFASRPLMHATFAINYYFGGVNTLGYHVVNICLHLLNGALLYLLVAMTGKQLGYDRKDVTAVALMSCALFVVHPLQTEAVDNTVHRSVLFSTTFYFLGTILFLKSVTAETKRVLYIGLLLAASLLGMGSREDFAMFPLMLVIYDLLFISKFRLKETLGHYKAYLPVMLSLGYLAYLVLNNTYKKSAYADSIPPMDYALTQFNVHWTYLRLFLLPFNQNIDHDYAVAKSLFELPTILSFSGYVGLWAVAVLEAKKRPLVAFPLLWFLVTLFPISFGVTFLDLGLDDVIFEHRLYLPGAGLMVAASLLTFVAAKTLKSRWAHGGRLLFPVFVVALLLLSGDTYARNAAWKDNIGLWKDALGKSPHKARVHHNLGNAYAEKGLTDKAIEHYRYAIKVRPNFAQTHFNIAEALKAKDQRGEAMEHLKTAIGLMPEHIDAHYVLGVMYMEDGDFESAKDEFRQVLAIFPGHRNARMFLEYLKGK